MKNNNDFFSIILSIASVVAALVALINEEYRVLIIAVAVLLIVTYAVYRLYTDIKFIKKEQDKINEKITIHKDISDLKAEMKSVRQSLKK